MERAIETCLDIFEQRGYDEIVPGDARITAVKPDGDQVCAFFIDAQFNAHRLVETVSEMHRLNIQHALVVHSGGVTPPAKKTVETSTELTFELFSESELQTNITRHHLQPQFYCLPPDEGARFKKKFNFVKLPCMLRTDPIARFYGYQRGDVVRITRPNNYVLHRCVR